VELLDKLNAKMQKRIDALREAKPEDFDGLYAQQGSRLTRRPLNSSMPPRAATTPR